MSTSPFDILPRLDHERIDPLAPQPGGQVYPPQSVLSLLKQTAPPQGANIRYRYETALWSYLIGKLETRLGLLYHLRRESVRLLARIALLTLKSVLLGRIDFRSDPHDAIAQAVFTHLYARRLHPLINTAFEDYLITGLGGVAFTPFGLAPLRPENSFAYPSFHSPEWTARIVSVPLAIARQVFTRRIKPDYGEQDGVLHEEPAVLVIEQMTPTKIRYYAKGQLQLEMPRPAGHGHLFLLGDPRTIDFLEEPNPIEETRLLDSHELDRGGDPGIFITWCTERNVKSLDLPVGLIEQLANTQHGGYNILEWYGFLFDAMLKRARRGNLVAVRPDLLDRSDQATWKFLAEYDPIATLGGDQPGVAIQFIDVVGMDELRFMLQEVMNQFSSLTGITPYMMAQVGVSDVASEVVTMQTQANARINQLHSYIAQWLARATDLYQQYLISLPQNYQEPVQVVVSPGSEEETQYGRRFLIFGAGGRPYSDAFHSTRIEPSLVGELQNIQAKRDLTEAIQLVGHVLPIAAEMGHIYDITQLVDNLLRLLHIDPESIKHAVPPPAAQPEPMPTPTAHISNQPANPNIQ